MGKLGGDPLMIMSIESMAAAGETTRTIAEALGISNATAGKWAKRFRQRERLSLSGAGARFRPVPISADQQADVERMVTLGVSAPVIARDLNISVTVVHRLSREIRNAPGFRSLANGRQPTGKLLSDEITQVKALALAGRSFTDISRELQIHRRTVASHARDALVQAGMALPKRTIAIDALTVCKIERMAVDGRTVREIALLLGLTKTTAHKYTHRFRRDHGLRCNHMRKLSQSEIKIVQDALANGLTMKEAARSIGLPVWKTWQAAAEFWKSPAGIARKAERDDYRTNVIARRVETKAERRALRLAASERRAEQVQKQKRDCEVASTTSSESLANDRDELFARISAHVPRHLDAALRDDIIMDVYQSILEEELNGRRQAEGDGEKGDFIEQDALSAFQGSEELGRGYIRGRQGDDARSSSQRGGVPAV